MPWKGLHFINYFVDWALAIQYGWRALILTQHVLNPWKDFLGWWKLTPNLVSKPYLITIESMKWFVAAFLFRDCWFWIWVNKVMISSREHEIRKQVSCLSASTGIWLHSNRLNDDEFFGCPITNITCALLTLNFFFFVLFKLAKHKSVQIGFIRAIRSV